LNVDDAELVARDGPDALTSDRRMRMQHLKRSVELNTTFEALKAAWELGQLGPVLSDFQHDRRWSHWQIAAWLGLLARDYKRLSQEPRPSGHSTQIQIVLSLLARRYGADDARLQEACAALWQG